MVKENLYTGPEVREKLASGIKKIATAVGSTMGTSGSNSIIESVENPYHFVTNDGYSIANSVWLEDPIENIGKNILLEAINRANKSSGDGSSTTCVITAAIIEEGQRYLSGHSPMEIKRQLEACIPLIEESINAQKKDITVDEVGAVAAISAEDPEIGARIQEIWQKIGKEGVIYWDISNTTEDSYTIGTGIKIEGAGLYSPYMADADEKGNSTNQVRLKNPVIMLTKQKITSAGDFNELFATLDSKQIKDVVVFFDDIEPLALPDFVKTRMVRGFRTVLVKMPTLWKDEWYEDLALASGATVIDPVLGLSIKQAKQEHLGRFDNITVTKDETLIDGMNDMSEHIASLSEKLGEDGRLRIARLNTKTARYFVGAQSDSALSYRRLKVEDALSAAWQALQNGIIIGGGLALEKASQTIDNPILKEALKTPHQQIVKNMGHDYTEKDMEEQNVYDPANVVLNAAKNAISVAASILTANTVVTLPRDDTPAAQPNALVR
jgi:chaperonin GroEL